ncbi:NERD domain-containing protein [Mycobacterium intermedium]|uniref:NERD domain-containing protein n=1 Tax=Mycobacterium intermedium TaxID=28445 RepID=UPI0008483973|nr:NERD domain-containing protein [Mycobacterium intermedium]
MKDGRRVTIADSQFAHEQQGLDIIKQLLPDAPPFRAWSNFEFRDNRGRWHEVDLLVLARDTLYLIELKHYRGILRGNDHVWMRDGYRAERSARRPSAESHMSRNWCSCTTPSSGASFRKVLKSIFTAWIDAKI